MRFVFITVLIQLLYFEVNAQNALYIPPTITGTTIDLELQTGTVQFFPGNPTNTLGANGAILGPTVVLDKLQDVM
ncbi:MAG: bilirubin oxidase, partial [Bacteroidota bacterium]